MSLLEVWFVLAAGFVYGLAVATRATHAAPRHQRAYVGDITGRVLGGNLFGVALALAALLVVHLVAGR